MKKDTKPKTDVESGALHKQENKVSDEKDKRHFLFSTTLLVEGIRCFADIPVSCEINNYPNRSEIFKFACDRYNREMSEELFNSFAILNIHEFKSKEDLDAFL